MKDELKFSYEEIFDHSSNCSHKETAFRYFERTLTREEEQQFENHLKECASCGALLAGLQESETSASATILDATKADQIFDINRRKLEQRLGYRTQERRLYTGFTPSRYLHVLMPVLIVVLLFSLYRNYMLQNEISGLTDQVQQQKEQFLRQKAAPTPPVMQQNQKVEPDISATAIYPVRMERSAGIPIRLLFDNAARSRAMVFALPSIDYAQYHLKLEQNGAMIWERTVDRVMLDSSSPLISVRFDADFLKSGEYLLTIVGRDENKETTIGKYPITVTHH